MSSEILVVRCGTVAYEAARQAQTEIEGRRQRGEVPDVLLLLEHPPVYTRGRRSSAEELPMGVEWYEAQGIEVRDTDRGGLVTYHGPGQLVAYPIVSLEPYGNDVHEFVRGLERVMTGALGEHGVPAQTIAGLTGVWTEGEAPPQGAARKIGSIGLHVSRGVTTHGLSVNVSCDLQPFEWIVPCGIEGVAMTSISRELGAERGLEPFAATLTRRYGEVFGRTPIPTESSLLGLGEPVATLKATP